MMKFYRVQDVVDLMSESLYHRLVDEKGSIEVGRSGGMSRSKETKRFVQYLCRLATEKDKPLFSRKVLIYNHVYFESQCPILLVPTLSGISRYCR